MRRRVIAALAAALLAVAGALVLLSYVRTADDRARADEAQVPALVVVTEVPAGTDAAALAGAVSVVDVPVRLAAPDVVADLATLTGQVTTVALLPGDQVLGSRFADPAALVPDDTVVVPEGRQQVAVTLEPQRAVGGVLAPGDLVGVYVSEAMTNAAGGPQPTATQRLDRVLVTRVQGGVDPGTDSAGAIAATGDPSGGLTVTVAVTPAEAAALISGMELGTVWMSLQTPAGSGGPTTTSTSTTGADQ